MRRLHVLLLSGIAMLAALGCEDNADRANHVLVQDQLGRTIRIRQPVRRLVSLSPSATELAFAAGAGSLFVGANVADDYPPEITRLPRFNTYPVDVEAIVALDPDLVLASDQVNHPAQVTPLQNMGIPTYFIASRSVAEIPKAIRELGSLFGSEETADTSAAALGRSLDRLRSLTFDLTHRPNVLVLAGSDPLYSFGSESYVHELVALAGGFSLTESFSTAAPVLSEEFVLKSEADVLIGADTASFSARHLLRRYPTWDVVPAVREGRVYGIDPDLLFRHGPRLIDGAYHIARLLHPEIAFASDE